MRKRFGLLLIWLSSFLASASAGMNPLCQGHFINPITDICWTCLFPITIGAADVVPGDMADTENPASPVQVCPSSVGYRIGITVGFWEPYAVTDVTRQPWCLVNMGGIQLDIDPIYGVGGHASPGSHSHGAFYYVHWYKYPLIYWLQLISYVGCMETGDFDLAYMTEIDPTWDDDELAMVLNPEVALFSSPPAQAACAADAVAASTYLPIDSLFWCLGAQGTAYPLTGHIIQDISPAFASVLLSERMAFKLHREGLIWETLGTDGTVCNQYPTPILPKSRYRYQMTNTIPAAFFCHPFGRTTLAWETGHLAPSQNGNFGYLIWRKRNCVFL